MADAVEAWIGAGAAARAAADLRDEGEPLEDLAEAARRGRLEGRGAERSCERVCGGEGRRRAARPIDCGPTGPGACVDGGPRDVPVSGRALGAGRGSRIQVVHGYEIPPGFEAAEEAARKAGHNFEVFKRMCRGGRIPGAYKIRGPGGGLWVVPKRFRILPTGEKPRTGQERGREVARRAHAGESKAALAREYGVNRGTVYNLMERYPDEAPGPARDGPEGPRGTGE